MKEKTREVEDEKNDRRGKRVNLRGRSTRGTFIKKNMMRIGTKVRIDILVDTCTDKQEVKEKKNREQMVNHARR